MVSSVSVVGICILMIWYLFFSFSSVVGMMLQFVVMGVISVL